ncbi:MAG: 16S rRNA (cytosine(1402)-N(4))-methyltransferase RsmH [Patescibacteria group bacterium]|nr:16S rRNA (cytosine(1402)-N(4))-methyltransferase RsmH [Patescibacteria group bacterium]
MIHKPVLLQEVIKYLNPQKNENFIDATFGLGGHSFEILKYIKPEGKILALEWDPFLVEIIKPQIMAQKNIILKNENFKRIKKIAKEENFTNVKGVIFDLGISNWHYQKSNRGFSFKKNEYLDMRINPYEIKLTAFDIINYFSKEELTDIFLKYGEEKKSKLIAEEIVKRRKNKKIETSSELAEITAEVKGKRKSKIHPATQVFMALRNFINQELENLEIGLEEAYEILIRGGRIAVISFNGLEDKVIKKVFKKLKNKRGLIITKNVVRPKLEEIQNNPSARSAKLRVIEKNDK